MGDCFVAWRALNFITFQCYTFLSVWVVCGKNWPSKILFFSLCHRWINGARGCFLFIYFEIQTTFHPIWLITRFPSLIRLGFYSVQIASWHLRRENEKHNNNANNIILKTQKHTNKLHICKQFIRLAKANWPNAHETKTENF